MSASLETYLVKLYLDRDGLELAARSFALKRARQAPRGRWVRLRATLRRWRGTS